MTIPQLTSAIATDTDFWRTLAEGLCTLLAGLLAFMGRRVLKAVDALDEKFEKVLMSFAARNDEWQKAFTRYDDRLDSLERRRKPRA